MRFGWDRLKSARNFRERGFDFDFATLVFDGPTLEHDDTRRDYAERRVIAIGLAQGFGLPEQQDLSEYLQREGGPHSGEDGQEDG